MPSRVQKQPTYAASLLYMLLLGRPGEEEALARMIDQLQLQTLVGYFTDFVEAQRENSQNVSFGSNTIKTKNIQDSKLQVN